jgi:hypothetical protein
VALLPDGRVLMVGGFNAPRSAEGDLVASRSTDIYDPMAGTFSPSGSMARERWLSTATPLRDGHVLVVGGSSNELDEDAERLALASAELYDPVAGTFRETGRMHHVRHDHTATMLRDGRVLIVGGADGHGYPTSSAEIYDPATGGFRPTGSMRSLRSGHTATLLADGRVLVVGGDDGLSGYASAEIYDPRTGRFKTTGSLHGIRYAHTATLLRDGRVLIAGGLTESGSEQVATTRAELYDPKTGKFRYTGSMSTGRREPTATLLSDGRVLIAGGDAGIDYRGLASAETYDPRAGKFLATGSMSVPRAWHTATMLPDGRVVMLGSATISEAVASLPGEIYDPATGEFSSPGG